MARPEAARLAHAIEAQLATQRALAGRLDRLGVAAAAANLPEIDTLQREIAGYCQVAAELQRALDAALGALVPGATPGPLIATLRRLPADPERDHLLRLAARLRVEVEAVAEARQQAQARIAALAALNHRSLQHSRALLDGQPGYDAHGAPLDPFAHRALLDLTT